MVRIKGRRSRRLAAVVAAAVVAPLLMHPEVASGAQGPLQETGHEVWVDRYDPIGRTAAGLEPLIGASGTLFSFGVVTGEDSSFYRVVAFDPATGLKRWVVERPGEINRAVLSSDGTRIYLAGTIKDDEITHRDWIVHALESSNGDELWSFRYRQRGRKDLPTDLAVSPRGDHLYVVGRTLSARRSSYDYTTVALDTESGEEEWSDVYDGVGRYDEATGVAVAPEEDAVFVTGFVTRRKTDKYGDHDARFETIAYGTKGGNVRLYQWVSWYNGPGREPSSDWPDSIATDGGLVYVTGLSMNENGDPDWLTIAYEADVGAQRWKRRYDPGTGSEDHPYALTMSPDRSRIYVTGDSSSGDNEAVTIAYRTRDGNRPWVAHHGTSGYDNFGWDVAASPDGRRVYVTGETRAGDRADADWFTLGYSARTGELEWSARYAGPNASNDYFPNVAVQPDSERVFVVGREWGEGDIAFTTVAYEPPRSV